MSLGLYDAVGSGTRLLATEVAVPATTVVAGATDRVGKTPFRPVPTTTTRTRGGVPWLPFLLVAILIGGGLFGGFATGLFGGQASQPSASPPVVPSLSVASPSASGAATCGGPSIEIVEHFYPDVAHTGGATTPVFSTPPGWQFCLIQLDTYHWNDGAGAPAGGTLSLLDSTGTTLGTWPATATPGTNDVLSGWEADVPTTTPVILDGSYSVEDSDPSTLSWSEASGGAGFLRVWAQLYAPPGTVYSPLPSTAPPSVPQTPASIVSISGMMQSDSPVTDSCTSSSGTKYMDYHYMYSFIVILAVAGQPNPPLSAYGNLIGRTATLTLVGSHDAGTYTTKVAVYSNYVQIRFDGRKCPNNAPRSTIGSLTIEGLTLRPGPGTGYLADPPATQP